MSEPRPSTSSNRSREADFEAALLTNRTVFLSTSNPTIEEGQAQSVQHDSDAPEPVSKRSFEQDYDDAARTPVKAVGSPAVIPPTPSTIGRGSVAGTSISNDSGGRRSSRIKPLMAVGMDGKCDV